MIVLKRVLVPTDFSPTSSTAVTYGLALARAFHAQLILLHVVSPAEFEVEIERERALDTLLSDAHTAQVVTREQLARQAAHEDLAKLLTPQEEQDVRAEYVLRTTGPGGPEVEIVTYARDNDIDLIVMGTHGRGFMAHMLMGSVAEKVVRKAPCPVLTVRHPEHEFVVPDRP